MKNLLLAGSLILSVFVCLNVSGASKKENPLIYRKQRVLMNESKERIRFIKAIVNSFRLQDMTDPAVVEKVYAAIDKQLPLDPSAPADRRSDSDIEKAADKETMSKNKLAEKKAMEAAEKKAETMFAPFKDKELVTVHYRRGRKMYQVKGIYYGREGRTVYVGMREIPFVDIMEQDQVHIDPVLAKEKRKEFIAKEVHAVMSKEHASVEKTIKLMKEKQEQNNISNGYILFGSKWLSVRDFAKKEILTEQKRQTGGRKKVDPEVQAVRKKISNEKKVLAKATGIDRDPGLNQIAFWGFSRKEVKIALQNVMNAKVTEDNDDDIVQSKDREIESIRLGYTDGKLTSVRVTYIKKTKDNVENVKKNLRRSYGADDALKIRKKGTPEPQPETTLQWTGKNTAAALVQEWKNGRLINFYFEKKFTPSAKKENQTKPADVKKNPQAKPVEKAAVPAKK